MLRILIVAVLASIVLSHKKHSKIQLMDVEDDEMMRTRSNDDENAILEDLEIGEYQDMEMNEMFGINGSSRGDETNQEKKTKKVNVDVNDFGEEEEDKGGGRDGPLIQNPTSMTNVALQITK